jgi:hypothetical protein
MIDFWIEVLWTLLIAMVMMLADFVASQWIAERRTNISIQRDIEKALTEPRKLKEHIAKMKERLDKHAHRRAAALAWGADLTAVALSLDLAVLELWILDPAMFPFFSRWNTAPVSREIPVWFIFLIAHLFLLMVSIIFKHLHGDRIEAIEFAQVARLFRKGWITQNRWMITSNTIGFLTLLSSFIVATNAI